MSKYRHHKYVWSKPFGDVRHWWELVGHDGAIHFHVAENATYGDSAGLEIHSLTGEGAPHHVNCPLTGGRCWHDGTSLYAMEHLWPLIKPYLQRGEHDRIFTILEREADYRFGSEEDQS